MSEKHIRLEATAWLLGIAVFGLVAAIVINGKDRGRAGSLLVQLADLLL